LLATSLRGLEKVIQARMAVVVMVGNRKQEKKKGGGRFAGKHAIHHPFLQHAHANPVSNCCRNSPLSLGSAVSNASFDLSSPLHGLPPSGEPGLFTAMHFVSPRPSEDGSSASSSSLNQRASTKSPPKAKVPKKALRRGVCSFAPCLLKFLFG